MFRVLCFPKPRVKRDVVIADLEVLTGRYDVDLPSNPIDDQPVTNLLSAFADGLHGEPFKVQPDVRIGFVPFPPFLFALFKRDH